MRWQADRSIRCACDEGRSSDGRADDGVLARSAKENEKRLPIHPRHFDRIDPDLRARMWLEPGYGNHYGVSDDQLGPLIAGFAPHAELVDRCDILLLPKPTIADVAAMREGQVLWDGRTASRTRS